MDDKKIPTLAEEKISDISSEEAVPGSTEIYIDPVKEKAVLKKFDKFFLPQAFLFLILNYLDRSNLGNAVTFGFSTDLGLVGNQFGNINTLFFVPYILFETPWVMAVKRFGPNKVLATALVCWSIVTIGTGFVQNYHQAIAVRMLLGACEAGVAPGFAFVFSSIYPRESTAKRIALTNLANATSGAFGGLFAYAIQTMGEQRGLAAWRWLFIIEGALSVILGGICWLTFPTSPDTAWFLNDEEKELMAKRKERNAAFRGEDKFDKKWAFIALKDPFMYLASIAFFFSSVAIFGFGTFLPTIIKGLGFASLKVNYMTIPVYITGAISLILQAYLSDKLQQRALFLIISAIPVITGYLICVGSASPGAGYAAMFICCTGVYVFSALVVTWVATNLIPDHKRSVGLPFFYSIGNLSGLISSQLYPSKDGPRYVMGNAVSAGMEVVAIFFVIAAWFLLRKRNQQKEKLIAEGATTNGEEGDEALDFKYTL